MHWTTTQAGRSLVLSIMKKCPWCGKEYPDDVSVCVTDGNPLESDGPAAVAPVEAAPPTPLPPQDVVEERIEDDPQESEDLEGSDGYQLFNVFSDALEADRLLQRLSAANISFRIARVEQRDGRGRMMGVIEVYVLPQDCEKASQILMGGAQV